MSDATALDYMRNHPFFDNLVSEYVDFLAQCASHIDVDAGGGIFSQGDRADRFYIVREGKVAVEVPALSGPALEIQSLGPDQLLGWSWLIPPYEWDFQARATRDCRLLQFDGKQVLNRCETDPAFGYQVLKRFTVLMSERLTSARRKMMDQWMAPGFA